MIPHPVVREFSRVGMILQWREGKPVMDMDDDRTARDPRGGRPILLDDAPTAVAVPLSATGGEPPDVIDVVFPATEDGRLVVRAHGRDNRRERLHERPLVLGGLAIAVVALAAAVAWQAWPRSSAPDPVDRRVPVPATAQPLSGTRPVAGALPPGSPHGMRRPAAGHGASGTPVADRAPTSGPGTAAGDGSAAPTPSAPSATGAPGTPSAPGDTPGTAPAAPRTLRAGDSGPDVTTLQRLLFGQGFTYVSTTGVYDAATVRGVTQAQRDRGLTCDPSGVYGPCTRAALTS